MRNIIDYAFARLLIFILAFITMSFFAKTFLLAILYALLITIVFSIILDIIRKKKSIGEMSFSQFLEHSIISGNSYILELTAKLLNIQNYTICDNAMTFSFKDKNITIVTALRFGNVSSDEIVKLHRNAFSKQIDELYLIARLLDRRAIAIANSFTDMKYIIISARRLYKLVRKKHLIPKPNTTNHKPKSNVKTIISLALSKNLAPKYLLTSVLLGLMSFFTPLKTYYYVMTAIALLLSILSFSGISNSISPNKLGIFGKNITKQTTAAQQQEQSESDKQ